MAVGYAKLPEYRIDNAMVDFSPIGKGAQAIAEGVQKSYDRTNRENFGNAMASGDTEGAMRSGALINPELAIKAGTYKNQQETHEIDYKKKTTEALGGHMQTIMDMKDPAEQAAASAKFFETHSADPKFAKDLARIGISDWRADPVGTVRTIHAAALGAQDPTAQAKTRAETSHLSTANAPAGANVINTNPDRGAVGQSVFSSPTKLHPDFEYIDPANPASGVRPRPGGAADTKLLEKQHAARAALDAANQGIESLVADVRQLHTPETKDAKGNVTDAGSTHPGLGGNFGLSGKVFNIPGGESANAYALLEKIRARGGFETLNALRAASKTGGALGAVSDAEGRQLQNAFAALQSAQGADNVKLELGKALKQLEISQQRLNEAYRRQYDNPQPTGAGQPAQYPGSQGQAQSGPATGPRVEKPNADRLPPQAAPQEGDTIVNKSTGQRMILRGGQWQPL